MQKKLFKLILAFSCIGMIGCDNKNSAETNNPGEQQGQQQEPQQEPQLEPVVFEEGQLGALCGEFYANDYVLNVTKDGAKLTQGDVEITLTNSAIIGTNYETKVTYTGSNQKNYQLVWAAAPWDVHEFGYMLPKLKEGQNELYFQPSLEAYQGTYDGYELYLDDGVIIYSLLNEFNAEKDYFEMPLIDFSWEMFGGNSTYWIKSAFIDYKEEPTIAISMFDSYDVSLGYNDEDWNYVMAKQEDTLYMLYVTDTEYAAFWTRPSLFLGEYWVDEMSQQGVDCYMLSGLEFSFIDEDNCTVYVGDNEEPSTYVEAIDEHGHYVTVDDMEIRPGLYGAVIKTATETKEYLPFFTGNLVECIEFDYSLGDHTISVATDWDTWEMHMYIDGQQAETEGIMEYNHQLVYYGNLGNDSYMMIPFMGTSAVKVVKNQTENYYFNETELIWSFVNEYYDQEFNDFIIDDDLEVTVGDTSLGTACFAYDEKFEVVGLSIAEVLFFFNLTDSVYCVYDYSTDGYGYVFVANDIDNMFNEWSNGVNELNLTKLSATYLNENYLVSSLDLLTVGDEYLPSVSLEKNNETVYWIAIDESGLMLFDPSTGSLISSFIDADSIESIIGEYCYLGTYGIERVIFTEEGKLFVDSTNSNGDGIEQVEYEYFVFYGEEGIILQFPYKGGFVNINFDGQAHCSIAIINYMLKEYFDVQGLYGTTKDNVFYVIDTNIVYNGTTMTVEEVNDNVFTGKFGDKDATVTFTETGVKIAVSGLEEVNLAKNETQLEDFVCLAKPNVGGLSRDIKVQADGIYISITGENNFKKVTDFEYQIDDSGNVSIVFKDSQAYTFTITIQDGVVVITGESSLPLF